MHPSERLPLFGGSAKAAPPPAEPPAEARPRQGRKQAPIRYDHHAATLKDVMALWVVICKEANKNSIHALERLAKRLDDRYIRDLLLILSEDIDLEAGLERARARTEELLAAHERKIEYVCRFFLTLIESRETTAGTFLERVSPLLPPGTDRARLTVPGCADNEEIPRLDCLMSDEDFVLSLLELFAKAKRNGILWLEPLERMPETIAIPFFRMAIPVFTMTGNIDYCTRFLDIRKRVDLGLMRSKCEMSLIAVRDVLISEPYQLTHWMLNGFDTAIYETRDLEKSLVTHEE